MTDKICPNCNSLHNKPGKFCSRKCANKRVHSQETKEKQSKALKGRIITVFTEKQLLAHKKQKKEKSKKTCIGCNTEFEILPYAAKQKYCCNECWKKHSGGYRKGSSRGKHGYYKNIWCDSTYELIWVIYRLDHNLPVKRFEGILQTHEGKYVPDFILNDKQIIEIKGYSNQTELDRKERIANENGYSVTLLFKKDLEKEFAYVTSKYNTKKYYTLYD